MSDLTLIQFEYEDHAPIGATYLSYGLERKNVDFDLKLYPSSSANLDELVNFIENSSRIIAIGCMTDELHYVIEALKRVKMSYPDKIFILGGTKPTVVAEDLLQKFNFIDFAIKGCGIISLPQLLNSIVNNKKTFDGINGLVYRKDNTIVSNPYNIKPIFPSIPAYHRIDMSRYHKYPIITSSGCPYKCAHCDALQYIGNSIRLRDFDDVINEIQLIKKLSKKRKPYIKINDEAFVVKRKRVLEFCHWLIKHKLSIEWECYGRVDRMDEELISTMSKSGCVRIYYGIESGSNSILQRINKGFSIEAAIDIVLLSKKYINTVNAAFIYRYPFEHYDDFISTIDVIKLFKENNVTTQLFPLAPIKSSVIFNQFKDRLAFSLNVPCVNDDMSVMPAECIELIKSNPNIFYDFYYYDNKDLAKMTSLLDDLDYDRFKFDIP